MTAPQAAPMRVPEKETALLDEELRGWAVENGLVEPLDHFLREMDCELDCPGRGWFAARTEIVACACRRAA